MGQVLPFHWMPESAKAFSFRGGSAPRPHCGLGPQTPVIGSRYRARHVSQPSHFSLRSDACVVINFVHGILNNFLAQLLSKTSIFLFVS